MSVGNRLAENGNAASIRVVRRRAKASELYGAGMTLVELLVVLAIIAALGAIAVPSAFKMVGTGRSDVDKATDEVHMLLKSSHIYAMSNHVKAGVVYRRAASGDYFDAIGMIVKDPESTDPDQYVPLVGRDGEFRLFQGTGCVLAHDPTSVTPATALPYPTYIEPMGLRAISLRFDTGELVPKTQGTYWAHVFEPTGAVLVTTTDLKEMYRLYVGYAPGTDEEKRFGNTDTVGSRAERYTAVALYRSTGRVKVVSE